MYEMVLRAQNHDPSAMEALVRRFLPLLKECAGKEYDAPFEDVLSEMIRRFMELILKLPLDDLRSRDEGTLVCYITSCVRNVQNAFWAKKRQSVPTVSWEDLSPAQQLRMEWAEDSDYLPMPESAQEIFLASRLAEKEKQVVTLYCLAGYNTVDIARMQGISHQGVNQTKNRALEKLKQHFIKSGVAKEGEDGEYKY